MKKISLLIKGIAFSAMAFCQPYHITQPINPADTGLVSLPPPGRRVWQMEMTPVPIVIDGIIDPIWDSVESKDFDRYITCRTAFEAGAYSCNPITTNRTPDNNDDFSGSYKITYDSSYIYLLYNVIDNEVNDGVINVGKTERLEVTEAPYPDSAQQLLQGKPFPPFSGVAPAENMKFCYWQYLGAFKINFFLAASPAVTINFDERPDATKINYEQRRQACHAAWKLNDAGSGYILEVALSLLVTLADSANTPFEIPAPEVAKFIAFDMFMFDIDNGLNQIKASWNAQDDCVWDNMLYTGKLRILNQYIGLKESTIGEIAFYPNPVSDILKFKETAGLIDIISINGAVVKSVLNTAEINVENLASGIYAVKINGKPAGKFIKL